MFECHPGVGGVRLWRSASSRWKVCPMWIGLAVPFVVMLGAMGMQALEPRVLGNVPNISDDPLQQSNDEAAA